MKVKLINQPNKHYSALYQVLYNRGIININKYLETNDKDINQPELLGEELLKRGAKMLIQHISNKDPILVIVDADCDGYTSSALLLNYLYDLFPEYTKEKIDYYLHLKKQHGLSDCIKECFKYKMILLPDASSNDASYHEELAAAGIDVLVLDHHDAEVDPSAYQNACIINNQLSEYPNKELSGVGVTWQFCRYLDKILNKDYANNYLDLVALGDSADMMDARSLETKALLFKGFKEENLKNPFIVNMIEKNNFSLNKADYKPSSNNELEITPMGASFFITPFVNAITRSGEIEEKDIVFTSMLKYKAFEEIPSTKRGHKLGEKERVIDQALRVCTNVKNRQTKRQTEGMELLTSNIKKYHMMDNKVLLFLLDEESIDRGILGLVANKIMAEYQRPTAILVKTKIENGEIIYSGSARGYGGIDFKSICRAARGCIFGEGHPGAFGLAIKSDKASVAAFIEDTNEILKDLSDEPSYFVDYIWDFDNIDKNKILDIANMNDYWGQGIERSLVYIKNIPITKDNFYIMKGNTLKYRLPSFIDIIQFKGTDEEIDYFSSGQNIKINAVCKCCLNEWNGNINPQLIMEDYDIVKEEKNILNAWGF